MSKMDGLQQALKNSSAKGRVAPPEPKKVKPVAAKPPAPARASSRAGKDYTGAWLNPDFGASLRLVQLSKRRDAEGNKIYLDDLIAEALNDLFIKYDVPTVRHN